MPTIGRPIAASTWLGCISADLHAEPESTAKPNFSSSSSSRSDSTLANEQDKNFDKPLSVEAISTSLICSLINSIRSFLSLALISVSERYASSATQLAMARGIEYVPKRLLKSLCGEGLRHFSASLIINKPRPAGPCQLLLSKRAVWYLNSGR